MLICALSTSAGSTRPLTGPQLEEIARLFAVLSEPSRLSLLQALHNGPLAVNKLMHACSMKQANVSKHLGVLNQHRLVKRNRTGNSISYQIADPMVFALCELVCAKMEQNARCSAALFVPDI